MERLTQRSFDGIAHAKCVSYYDIIDKLAEYEDAEEQGFIIKLPCKVGDTVYELCKCNDDVYRIFPMVVKSIAAYGSIRKVKGKEAELWNIYAESDYTYMYKKFHDFGKTVFRTKKEAEQAIARMEKK